MEVGKGDGDRSGLVVLSTTIPVFGPIHAMGRPSRTSAGRISAFLMEQAQEHRHGDAHRDAIPITSCVLSDTPFYT